MWSDGEVRGNSIATFSDGLFHVDTPLCRHWVPSRGITKSMVEETDGVRIKESRYDDMRKIRYNKNNLRIAETESSALGNIFKDGNLLY